MGEGTYAYFRWICSWRSRDAGGQRGEEEDGEGCELHGGGDGGGRWSLVLLRLEVEGLGVGL